MINIPAEEEVFIDNTVTQNTVIEERNLDMELFDLFNEEADDIEEE